MKKIQIVWLFSMFLSIAGAQDSLSFQDAIRIGLENNFDVKIASNNVRLAENNVSRGNAGYLPTVIGTGGRNFTRQNVKQEFITGTVNERDGATSNNWNAGVSATWTLFDGLQMFKTYDRLKEERELSEIEEKITIENTILNIALAYHDIILEKNRLSALDSSLVLSEKRVNLSESRYDVGKAPRGEFLSAQVDYNSDYSELIRQREFLRISKNELNNFMGRDITTEFVVPFEIELDTTLELDQLKMLAMHNNNVLNQARQTGEIIQLEAEEIKSENLPQVDLDVSYNFNRSSSQAGFLLSNRTLGLNYGLSASWLLYDGKDRKRRHQNAVIDLENNQHMIDKLELEIQRDLENTYLEYTNNLHLIKLEEENYKIATENEAIALDRYQLGKSNFLELREAQINVILTFGRLQDAYYLAKVNELNLLLLSGQIVN